MRDAHRATWLASLSWGQYRRNDQAACILIEVQLIQKWISRCALRAAESASSRRRSRHQVLLESLTRPTQSRVVVHYTVNL